MTFIRGLKSNNFKNNQRTNTKMSATAYSSMVVGLIIGWYYKDSKVLSLIISAVTGG